MSAPTGAAAPGSLVLPVAAARAVGFTALALYALSHWMAMLAPAASGRALAGVAVAVAAGAGMAAMAALPGRAGLPASLVVFAAGCAGALVVGGIAMGDLWAERWGALADRLGDGLAAVGGARVPYGGGDADVRAIIGVGGTLLVLAAGFLAFSGARRGALVVLIAVVAVPFVVGDPSVPFLRGAALFALVVAYVRLDGVLAADVSRAATGAVLVGLAALALAPGLDADDPWFDYEAWSAERSVAAGERFTWDHDYRELKWPRDGTELLRVQGPPGTYLTAQTLGVFDGQHWIADEIGRVQPPPLAGVPADLRTRWTADVAIGVRGLRSATLPLPGTPERVRMPDRSPEADVTGAYGIGRALHRGDSYTARAYVPRPATEDLMDAGAWYPEQLAHQTTFSARVGRRLQTFFVPGFFGGQPRVQGYAWRTGRAELAASDLRRVGALAHRLRAGAGTPFEYLRRIEQHLGQGFAYDERPPSSARTLDGFLFDARAGHCQQFSGAMALLLRMGGVPARVATGFAPGSERNRGQVSVLDTDAHSWVEAWFPGYGWIVFDPTPAASPAARDGSAPFGLGDAPVAGPADREGGLPLIAVAALALLAAAAVAAFDMARARARAPRADGPLADLERALRVAGEPPVAPPTTLAGLAGRYPDAAGYLRALQAARFGTGPPPTSADRRALRAALTRGRGPLPRLRTRLALRARAE